MPGASEDPEEQLSLSRDRARLQAALEELPGEQREVFLLRPWRPRTARDRRDDPHARRDGEEPPALRVAEATSVAGRSGRHRGGIHMNQEPRKPDGLERDLLAHFRAHDAGEPSAELDARILAAARDAVRPARPGLGERLHAWLFGPGGRQRWSVAFAGLACLGIGVSLTWRNLDRPELDYESGIPAPAAMRAPAPSCPSPRPLHRWPAQASHRRGGQHGVRAGAGRGGLCRPRARAPDGARGEENGRLAPGGRGPAPGAGGSPERSGRRARAGRRGAEGRGHRAGRQAAPGAGQARRRWRSSKSCWRCARSATPRLPTRCCAPAPGSPATGYRGRAGTARGTPVRPRRSTSTAGTATRARSA